MATEDNIDDILDGIWDGKSSKKSSSSSNGGGTQRRRGTQRKKATIPLTKLTKKMVYIAVASMAIVLLIFYFFLPVELRQQEDWPMLVMLGADVIGAYACMQIAGTTSEDTLD